tara:strand:- start:6289 stop:6726 length:438 start_codon:yes stop_codon:yes gene_type:complete
MATFNKVNDFVLNAVQNMDLESDQVVVALSNTAPASESPNPATDGNGVLASVTQIAYTNLNSRNVTTTSSTQTGGTYKLVLADITLTSSGGSTGPFRYVYIFNDTVSSPVKPLIGFYDYGSSLTLNDGDSLTVDFSAANGVLQIA